MELTQQDYVIIRDYIHAACGIDLVDDKQYLVHQRLEPVAEQFRCADFQQLAGLLLANTNPLVRDQVVAAITTNETSFFRDGHPYELFRSFIMPKLAALAVQRKNQPVSRKGAKVSILSAGSSTGQEPYSLSMIIHEYCTTSFAQALLPQDFAIVATDISSTALSKAIAGLFSDIEMNRGLSEAQKNAHFYRHPRGDWEIKESIRSIVEFRRVNLIESFLWLGGFDVIFCRNVLIYFDTKTRKKIFDQFYQILTNNGLLILGTTENIYAIAPQFESRTVGPSMYYVKNELSLSQKSASLAI
ncbi:MAG: protein-glutamate O-methyltransferase CheR [Chitinivibrionales bacterium]|nr:protein-glutamate O-methyltransferase CheR [Chitinivibrionales bacterium]